MDATAIFPQGFHPVADMCLPNDTRKAAPCLPRSTVPVKYYYADFGISTMFAPGDTDRLVTGTHGLDRDVPELSDDVPYDPFKVDVFILGNLIRTMFVEASCHVILRSACFDVSCRNIPMSTCSRRLLRR